MKFDLSSNLTDIMTDKERDILLAGEKLFRKYGFQKVTMEELSKKAKVSKVTFYKYFKGKDFLIRRYLEILFEEMSNSYYEVLNSNKSMKEKFDQAILIKLDYLTYLGDEILEALFTYPVAREFYEEYSLKGMQEFKEYLQIEQVKGNIAPTMNIDLVMAILQEFGKMLADGKLSSYVSNFKDLVSQVNKLLVYGLLKKNRMKQMLIFIIIITSVCNLLSLDLSNRVSAYGDVTENNQVLGIDWTFGLNHSLTYKNYSISGDYSLYSQFKNEWDGQVDQEYDIKSYRYYLSLSKPQTELRVGLQRLNFGTAKILRALQWFDQIDPLDAYQVTSGVKAVLVRHHWLNNANVWFWGMLGSQELKGNELYEGNDKSLEYGGRIQYPTKIGDLGVTYNNRELKSGHENRYGIDLRTDGVIGAWVESSFSYYNTVLPIPEYLLLTTLGLDYVFSLGNGVAITLENMVLADSKQRISSLIYQELVSALLISYPIGLLDNIQILGSYAQESEEYLGSINWRRTYDYFAFDFSMSDSKTIGTSLQIMITANF